MFVCGETVAGETARLAFNKRESVLIMAMGYFCRGGAECVRIAVLAVLLVIASLLFGYPITSSLSLVFLLNSQNIDDRDRGACAFLGEAFPSVHP